MTKNCVATTTTRSVVALFLCATALLAGAESGVPQLASPNLAPGHEPEARKVFIVQLRRPSAGEYFARAPQSMSVAQAPGDTRRVIPKRDSAAMRAYAEELEGEQRKVLATVGSGTRPVYSYRYSMNGFAAVMSNAQAQKLRKDPDVIGVWEDEIRPLATTDSPAFLGLFDAEVGLRTRGFDGDGLVIGVIDSGVAPEHPALSDTRKADRPKLCRSNWGQTSILGMWLCRRFDKQPDVLNFEPPEDWNGVCQAGDRFDDTHCNNKLIGARWYADGALASGPIDDNEIFSPRDADGHGTHTATTAAGNSVPATMFGTSVGTVQGIAPRARVAVYKACWLRPGDLRASCNTSDLKKAIDDAVADGVDIINYSVGSSLREVAAPDDMALLNAAKAGVVAAVAAGNEGPNFATIGSPAGAPWVITTAASSRPGNTAEEGFQIEAPATIAGRYPIRESRFSQPLADVDPVEGKLVLVDDGDTSLPTPGRVGVTSDGCQPLINRDEVSGNIALMQRSGCLFTDMVRHAEEAGAIAALIYNIAGDPIVMYGQAGLVDIPALMIGQADANLVLAEFDEGNDVTVTLEKSLLFTSPETGNIMASFSARGPGPGLDILKPDVTAPGVNIVAGFTPDAANATQGENFAFLSGTSMAAPHVAGAAALLRQEHPGWSAAAIKSALMTTARRDVKYPASEAIPNPFDYGSGHIDPNRAADPGLVYDASDDEYDAYACGIEAPEITAARCDELAAAGFSFDGFALNQPNIAVSSLTNVQTVTRRVTNVSDTADTYTVSVNRPPGISVDVSPSTLSVGPGESATYDVTFRYDSALLDYWVYGSLTWSDGKRDVYSSLAVKPTSITAPEEVTGTGGTGSLSFPVEFGYDGSYTPDVDGLTLPYVFNLQIQDDPNNSFSETGPGVIGIGPGSNPPVDGLPVVPANTRYLRFALLDELTDGNDDLDLYVYYCGLDNTNCRRVGESGSFTSNEEVSFVYPLPGVYNVYIHGFETDEVTGGPGANFQFLMWIVGGDAGNMSAAGPALVAPGTTADVTVDWSNLISNTIYLGTVSHTTPRGVAGITVVRIRN